jgi:hypothetical protein
LKAHILTENINSSFEGFDNCQYNSLQNDFQIKINSPSVSNSSLDKIELAMIAEEKNSSDELNIQIEENSYYSEKPPKRKNSKRPIKVW